MSSRAKPLHEYPALVSGGTVLSHYGVDSSHYNTLSWLSDEVVLMPAGKFLLFVNVKTGLVESLEGPAGGGVGTAAVHPSHRYFVVGERSPRNPRLLVYEWPSRELVGEFEGSGSTTGYAACSFDAEGTRLATVAAAPDYTLTVWDWQTRTMELRSKCFSSDVYTVRFSSFDNSRLVTGGSGHVKFWSMAETFTGLKLQGTLGKFGRLDISNVSGFVVLPDGKVLSGSESGSLLLWEGDLVKCSFVRSLGSSGYADEREEDTPCHDGAINAVALVHDAMIVVTFGDDGWIRYWNREELELAEGEGVPARFAPQCVYEVCVNPYAPLRSVTLKGGCDGASPAASAGPQLEWVLLDGEGTLSTSPLPSLAECLGESTGDSPKQDQPAAPAQRFNGGGLTCCAASPVAHVAVTGGEDGVVRLLDYVSGTELAHIRWPNVPTIPDADSESQSSPLCDDNKVSSVRPSSPAAVTTIAYFANDPTHTHLVAGFGDGTIRLLTTVPSASPCFSCLGQWRPHASDLFASVLDPTERHLCTVARDGTAFFFAVAASFDTVEPIGFCKLPLPAPTCAEWDEAGEGCFVGFASGQVLSIRAPKPCEVNQAESFEFTCRFALVGMRQRRLPPPVPEDEQKLEDNEADILEAKDQGPWAVSLIRRLPGSASGAIAVGMQKEELLYVYQGTVRYPDTVSLPQLPPTGVEPPNYVEEPGENICYRDLIPQHAFPAASGLQLLVVCHGAQVVVREAGSPAELCTSSAKVSLMTPAHDGTRGGITSAQISFDGAMVITTGTDGLMVAQLRNGYERPKLPAPRLAPRQENRAGNERQKEERGATSLAEPPTAPPVALTIQQQKEADDDAHARAVKEEKRRGFLRKVLALQEQYAALSAANMALPEEYRLPEEDMLLDHTLRAKLEDERRRRVEEARKEYAVESARERLRTAKLRNRFVDNLLYDRFLVHAFHGEFSVASFRTANPAAAIARLEGEIAALEASDDDSDNNDEERTESSEGGAPDQPTGSETAPHAADRRPSAAPSDRGTPVAVLSSRATADVPRTTTERTVRSKMNASVKQQLQKADERREERQAQREGYAALLTEAPNPEDDKALLDEMTRRDTAERGECVLRTDPQYQCRRDFRPTASAKLSRMIALENALVGKRAEFNERLLAMRERKRSVLEAVNRIRARILEISEELRDDKTDGEAIRMQPDEEPERVFKIDRAGLDAYAKRKALERLKEEEAKKAQRGFGADLAEAPQQQQQQTRQHQSMGSGPLSAVDTASTSRRETLGTHGGDSRSRGSRNASRLARSSRQSTFFLSAADRGRAEADVRAKLETIKPSEMEEEEQAMRREQLSCERQRLQRQVEEIMHSFDEDLYQLYRQHASVEADLCLGGVHLLLLFREYQMLLVFRNQDDELRRQLRSAKASRETTRRGIQALQRSLQDHEAHLATLHDRLKLHKRDAEAYIQESCPADRVAYLLKVFNRHIKRRKNVDAEEDNDDITSDDEDDAFDDEDSDIAEELCPPNCDPEVWSRTLALREARLDISDELGDWRRRRDETSKQLEQSGAALEGLDAGVTESIARIEALEQEKRRQLNLLSTVVPLRTSQVKCIDPASGGVPDALWDERVVVLSEEELRRLAARVGELAEQKRQRRLEIAGMAAELQRLQADMAVAQGSYTSWESQVHDMMMLKFGQHVDLEMLESCGTSRRIEAKKEELRRTELRWDREVRKQENAIAALRDRLQRSLLQNTHLLQDLGDYEGERQETERTMNKAATTTAQKFRGSRVATKADRANLRELIAAQQEEMDALTAEIFMLRRKGGHAYTPGDATY